MHKLGKEKDVDRILTYLRNGGGSDNPLELSEEDELKRLQLCYCDKVLKEGYSRNQVVNMLRNEFVNPDTGRKISVPTAYRIINETAFVFSHIGTSPKEYAKVLAEDFLLQIIRKASAGKDHKTALAAVNQYIKLHGLGVEEGNGVPPDALSRHVVYFVTNPEEVGLKRLSQQDMDDFYRKMTAASPKVIDITAEQEN